MNTRSRRLARLYLLSAFLWIGVFSPAGANPSGNVVFPSDFPADPALESNPVLKRKKSEPLNISFTDAVTNKSVVMAQLKGKVVYVHSLDLSGAVGEETLKGLKQLHDKYAKRGFEIITLHTFLNSQSSAAVQYTRKAVLANAKKLAGDCGITWFVHIHDKAGYNSLIAKLTGQDSIRAGLLYDPEGKLVHANVSPSTSLGAGGSAISLARALNAIFPD